MSRFEPGTMQLKAFRFLKAFAQPEGAWSTPPAVWCDSRQFLKHTGTHDVIPSTTIARAQTLLARGTSRREIARLTDISKATVDLIALGKLVPDQRAQRESKLAIKDVIEPVKSDIDKVAQALARAIADSRVVRRNIARCPYCGRGFTAATGRGEAAMDYRRALRIHLLNVQPCKREMLEDGKVPPDTRRTEPQAITNGAAGVYKSDGWQHTARRAGHDSNYAGE